MNFSSVSVALPYATLRGCRDWGLPFCLFKELRFELRQRQVTMRKASAGLLGILVTGYIVVSSGGIAGAQSTATNVQDGENRSRTSQSGSGKSGDAITGQVTGVVSGG